MPTLVSELCTPNIQNVRRTHRRQRDYDMAIVQLFRRRRSTMTIKPVDLDFQPRAHAAVSRRLCDCFAATVQLFRRRQALDNRGTIKPVDLDFQPRAHAAVSRRLCDCFAATVQLFRRRRSTRQSSPSTWTFNRGHTRRCRGGCVTASRRPCSYFGGGARHDNQARRPGLSTEGTRGGVAAVV
jgi:hypothetical protein